MHFYTLFTVAFVGILVTFTSATPVDRDNLVYAAGAISGDTAGSTTSGAGQGGTRGGGNNGDDKTGRPGGYKKRGI
ncbi:hypothetical protein MFLAVUS_000214 [Mucor flavus]|uniref:Glycine-rich protein n=1 Tax=Mucor flavus TaxID=439312 RepID=A0ABP9YJ48_9FUNG